MKTRNYTPGKKTWPNSKYIKAKQNRKLMKNNFRPFQILLRIEKQTYTLELSTKQKVYNVFYVSLLKQNIIKNGRVNEQYNNLPESEKQFEAGDNKKYEVKVIINSMIYDQKING